MMALELWPQALTALWGVTAVGSLAAGAAVAWIAPRANAISPDLWLDLDGFDSLESIRDRLAGMEMRLEQLDAGVRWSLGEIEWEVEE